MDRKSQPMAWLARKKLAGRPRLVLQNKFPPSNDCAATTRILHFTDPPTHQWPCSFRYSFHTVYCVPRFRTPDIDWIGRRVVDLQWLRLHTVPCCYPPLCYPSLRAVSSTTWIQLRTLETLVSNKLVSYIINHTAESLLLLTVTAISFTEYCALKSGPAAELSYNAELIDSRRLSITS